MANIFKTKFMRVPYISFLNSFREIGRNAFVDWLLILIVNLLTMLVLVTGGVYLYWRVYNSDFVIPNPVIKTNEKVSNEKELNDIIKYFTNKEDNTNQAKLGYRGVTDPSI